MRTIERISAPSGAVNLPTKDERDDLIWTCSNLGNRQKFVALGLSRLVEEVGPVIPTSKIKQLLGGTVSSDEYPFVQVNDNESCYVDWADLYDVMASAKAPKKMTMTLLEEKVIPTYNHYKPVNWKSCRKGNPDRLSLSDRMYQTCDRAIDRMLQEMKIGLVAIFFDPFFSGQTSGYVGEFDRFFYKNRYAGFYERGLEMNLDPDAVIASKLSPEDIEAGKKAIDRTALIKRMGLAS